MRMFKRLIVTISLLSLTGCGTIISYRLAGSRIYGGVRCGGQLAYETFPFGVLFLLLDFPFSFLADTLTLPWTIPHAEEFGERPLETPFSGSGEASQRPPIANIEGFVVQADTPKDQVFEAVPIDQLPPDTKPLSGVGFKLFLRQQDPEARVFDLTLSDASGHFQLYGEWSDPWKTIHLNRVGYKTLVISVSSLHSPLDKEYWDKPSLDKNDSSMIAQLFTRPPSILGFPIPQVVCIVI
ncbi:MAG TPA: hypothetical protein VKU80_19140 [Planctomycetota bacterium]|nr:hypothetical protein [Planctomycetota bacterium]